MNKAYINLEVKEIDIFCEMPVKTVTDSNFEKEYEFLGKGYIIYAMEDNKPTQMSITDYYCYGKKMNDFSRKQPTSQGGYLVKSSGKITGDGCSFDIIVTEDTLHHCPYCNYDILESSVGKEIISDSTIGEEAHFPCNSCGNEIYINYQWVCDPECESDGVEVYNLYTKEDYEDIIKK